MVVVEAKPDNISHRYTDTHTQTYAEAHGRPTWQWQGAQGGLDEVIRFIERQGMLTTAASA